MNFLLKKEHRCLFCGKLLFKGILFRSRVEIKCLRCGKVIFFRGLNDFDGKNRYMLLTDTKGKIVDCSDSIRKVLAIWPSDLIEENIDRVIADKFEKETDKVIALRSQGKKYLRFDTWHKKGDGDTIPVSIRYNFLKSKNGRDLILRVVDKILPVGKNIIKQSTFPEKNQCDFTIEVDENGTILYGSNGGRDILGFTPKEAIGEAVGKFQVPEEVEMRKENYKMLLAKKVAYRIPDNRCLSKSGNVIEYETFCSPNFSSAGDFVGYHMSNWLKK